eukprot:Hpha_TRINITY_DN15917_c0_g1::TRINITY_DN15917_c0_g1_i1::g.74816::m.74816/K14292/TGS1; trimethylguanosine synthase
MSSKGGEVSRRQAEEGDVDDEEEEEDEEISGEQPAGQLANVPLAERRLNAAYWAGREKIGKYFAQRYRFFSLYDKGILMDEESWFSVTPEMVAWKVAERCKATAHDVIIDAFAGAGGNTIQFAKVAKRVIAIDHDPQKLMINRRNAEVYGVEKKIDYVLGDYTKLLPSLEADIVFLSPPWGGPNYNQGSYFDLREMKMGGLDGVELLKQTRRHITGNVIYFLPKNVRAEQVVQLAEVGEPVEVEQNIVSLKCKSTTVYYGNLVMDGRRGRPRINDPAPRNAPMIPISPDKVFIADHLRWDPARAPTGPEPKRARHHSPHSPQAPGIEHAYT